MAEDTAGFPQIFSFFSPRAQLEDLSQLPLQIGEMITEHRLLKQCVMVHKHRRSLPPLPDSKALDICRATRREEAESLKGCVEPSISASGTVVKKWEVNLCSVSEMWALMLLIIGLFLIHIMMRLDWHPVRLQNLNASSLYCLNIPWRLIPYEEPGTGNAFFTFPAILVFKTEDSSMAQSIRPWKRIHIVGWDTQSRHGGLWEPYTLGQREGCCWMVRRRGRWVRVSPSTVSLDAALVVLLRGSFWRFT